MKLAHCILILQIEIRCERSSRQNCMNEEPSRSQDGVS
jgi:hypothetical protein